MQGTSLSVAELWQVCGVLPPPPPPGVRVVERDQRGDHDRTGNRAGRHDVHRHPDGRPDVPPADAAAERLVERLPPDADPSTLSLPEGTTIERIGTLEAGRPGIRLLSAGKPVPLPERLGFEHSHDQHRGLSRSPVADRP